MEHMTGLLILTAIWLGGTISSIGYMLAGMTLDNQPRTWFDYFHGVFACLFWPFTILQMMTTNEKQ